PFGVTLFGHVLDAERDVWSVVQLSGLEQEDAVAERFEGVFDLVFPEHALFRKDFLQKISQVGNIPLAVTEIVDESSFRFLFGDLEVTKKGFVGSDHA